MKYLLIMLIILGSSTPATGQKAYKFSILSYQEKYRTEHEVVKGKDKKYFHFYAVDAAFNVTCSFELGNDTTTVAMKTTGTKIPVKEFTRYGKVSFVIHDTTLQLTVFKSKTLSGNPKYRDYLFIPFTDLTSGETSYGGGRYLDIQTSDIKDKKLQLDFNKAYNPYCAYTTGYNCPIPLRENDLSVAVLAGEAEFGKGH